MEVKQKRPSARPPQSVDQTDQGHTQLENTISQLDEVEAQVRAADETRERLKKVAAIYPLMAAQGFMSQTAEEAAANLLHDRQTIGQ